MKTIHNKKQKHKKKNNTRKNNQAILDRILYKNRVLAPRIFHQVRSACDELQPALTEDPMPGAYKRFHVIITDPESSIYKLFYGVPFMKRVSTWIKGSVAPHPSLPIEYREYAHGSSMRWHRDLIITDNGTPQIELVFTIRNTSNSRTEWFSDKTRTTHRIHSEPNSVMITQGGSVMHQVTPLTSGERTIVKVAYLVV